MLRLKRVVLVIFLLAATVSGCSRAEPTPRDFILMGQRPAKAEETGNTLKAARAACKAETESKGISNVAAVVSRLRPGKVDEDYIACMKARGYEPAS